MKHQDSADLVLIIGVVATLIIIGFACWVAYLQGKLRESRDTQNALIEALLASGNLFGDATSSVLSQLAAMKVMYCDINKGDDVVFLKFASNYLVSLLYKESDGETLLYSLAFNRPITDKSIENIAIMTFSKRDHEPQLLKIFDCSYEKAIEKVSFSNFVCAVKSHYFANSNLYPYFFERIKNVEKKI